MMYLKDINDNQIQVLGICEDNSKKVRRKKFKIKMHIVIYVCLSSLIIILMCIIIYLFIPKDHNVFNDGKINVTYYTDYTEDAIEYYRDFIDEYEGVELDYFEKNNLSTNHNRGLISDNIKNEGITYTEMIDTVVNDIPLRIYKPHNAVMSLHHGPIDLKDSTIVYVAQAADIRADNGNIVGDFILNGETISKGIFKRGFCASIDGKIYIGMGNAEGFVSEAIRTEGYLFRQYPLVYNGKWIKNKPKGKSIRRSICQSNGQTFMVETISRESFYDFAQSLVDLGIDNAIYLVGSNTYGWAMDKDNVKHEFGNKEYYTNPNNIPQNINYIVWRKP